MNSDRRRRAPGAPTKLLPIIVIGTILAFANNQSIGITVPVFLTRDLGRTAADVGLVGALATLGAVAGRLAAGHLVNRYGAGTVLIVGVSLLALLSASYLGADTLRMVAVIRSLHLLVFAAVTTAAVIAAAEAVPARRRGAAIAAIGMAMPISAMIFPALAAEALQARLGPVALLGASLAVVSGFLFARVHNAKGAASIPTIAPLLDRSPLVSAPLLALLAATAIGATDAVAIDLLPVLAFERDIGGYGWFYSVFAVAMVATLVGLWHVKWQDYAHRVTQFGLLATGVGFVILAAAADVWGLLLAAAIYGIGFATAQTGLTVWAVSQTNQFQRAQRIGRLYLLFDVGRSVGVYTGGWGATILGFFPTLLLVAAYCGLYSAALWRSGRVTGPAPLPADSRDGP